MSDISGNTLFSSLQPACVLMRGYFTRRKRANSYLQYKPSLDCALGWIDDLRFYVLFNSISVIYQHDGLVIMKGCVQWNPLYN